MNARNPLLDLVRPLHGGPRPRDFPGSRAYRTYLAWTAIRSFGEPVPAPKRSIPCPRCGQELDSPAHDLQNLRYFEEWRPEEGQVIGLRCGGRTP